MVLLAPEYKNMYKLAGGSEKIGKIDFEDVIKSQVVLVHVYMMYMY